MSTELATRNLMPDMDGMKRAAMALYHSRFFNTQGNETQAIAQLTVQIMAGAELGFGPYTSVKEINIISGKPVMSANLLATCVKRHPHYDYRIKTLTDTKCVLEFSEKGQVTGESQFTMEDAKQANLGGKGVWKNYPRNMLFARAISNGVRWFCPDVFGGQAIYTAEEMGEEDGTEATIDVDMQKVPEVSINGDEGDADDDDAILWSKEPKRTIPVAKEEVETPALLSSDPAKLKQFQTVGSKTWGKQWDEIRKEIAGNYDSDSANDIPLSDVGELIDNLKAQHQEAIVLVKGILDDHEIAPADIAYFALEIGVTEKAINKWKEGGVTGYAILNELPIGALDALGDRVVEASEEAVEA